MKRVLTCGGGLLLSIALVSTAFAGAIDNKTNWSAEYIRTFNRNAATDYADIAAYNPAGTVKLQDGFILNGSVQYLNTDIKNIFGGKSYEDSEPPVIPSIFAVYNKDRWSLYGAFAVVGGGGKVEYSQGNLTTVGAQEALIFQSNYDPEWTKPFKFVSPPGPSQLTGESYYLGYTFGGAYEINDMFSISVGFRLVDAQREGEASLIMMTDPDFIGPLPGTMKFEENGKGWGGIFGVNIAPNDKLNIGMRYEMKTNLDLKASVDEDTFGLLGDLLGIEDGKERPRDLPALFGFGLSYWLNPKLRAETNFTYYFNDNADWGGDQQLVDNGFDVGIAFEYHFSDSFLGSIGYNRTETGIDPQNMSSENPELDANTLCGGIAYAFNEQFHINLGLSYISYEDDSFYLPKFPPDPIGTVKYEKTVIDIALGLEYRF
jgi:long-chain fatty acid transport protein